ncbi:MAG TPA: MFS transporter [Candidatus Limnocylindrales bacterium]|nr:MFS transporter [Candidatus Limnocylindrales bacterium]
MPDPTTDQAARPAASVAAPRAGRLGELGRGLDRSLALLAAIAFITQIGVAIMLPLLPLYAVELGASPIVLGLLTSVFALTNAGGQLLAGFISDRAGPRRLIPAGLGLYAASNILISTATSALPLIVWRGLAGIGGGTSLVAERLYIRRVVDQARLAFANGILSSAGSAGAVAGPAVGGLVAAVSDLRVPFLIVGVTSTLATIASLFLPRIREGAIAAAGATVTAFRLDRRALGILLLANLGLMAGYGSFITTYAPFAQGSMGWTTAEIGILFSLFGLGSITLGPALGAAADRWGRRPVGALSTIPVVVFAVALVLAAPSLVLYAIAAAAGGGLAGFNASWFALLGTATGGPRGGRAFGTVSAMSNLGIVLGALTAARLWETVDIRAGMLVTIGAIAFGGIALAAYPEGGRAGDAGALA